MSDRYGASITIPKDSLQIAAVLEAINGRLSAEAEIDENEDGSLRIYDGQTTDGTFDVEDVLLRIEIAFDATSEACYSQESSHVCYRPGEPGGETQDTSYGPRQIFGTYADQGGNPMYPLEALEDIAKDGQVSLDEIRSRFGPPALTVAEWATKHANDLAVLREQDPTDPSALAEWEEAWV